MRRTAFIPALVLSASLFVAVPLSALAWDDAPPVVDCSGTSYPALSFGTEDAYHAAVSQRAATTCTPSTPPAPPSPPAAPPSNPPAATPPSSDSGSGNTSRVLVCHADDDPGTLVQSVSLRHVQPDQVQKYLSNGLDFLMPAHGDCGPTTP